MNARIIDGKQASQAVCEAVGREAADLRARGVVPGLAVILVGEDPASQIYVRNKARACERAGIYSLVIRMPAETTQEALHRQIEQLNEDMRIHAILVQLPLPAHLDEASALARILPEKDADGFTLQNAGALLNGTPGVLPCTPRGIIELLRMYDVPMAGADAVVIGRSNIVGKPAALLLTREHATVTLCHSRTRHLADIARRADILVAALGKPGFVTADMVKPGAAVIDVGINRLADGSLSGDVAYEEVSRIAGWITPVPGGVGPMTIAMLLRNTVEAAAKYAV